MKKIIFLLLFYVSFSLKIKASDTINYLITSPNLPYYFIISQSDNIHMYCFPNNLNINHLHNYELKIDHEVILNLDKFKPKSPLNNALSCRQYLSTIIKQLSYQDLFKLQDYLTSSLTFSDYLKLFPLIKNPPKVNYYYGNYLIINHEYYPLDYTLK